MRRNVLIGGGVVFLAIVVLAVFLAGRPSLPLEAPTITGHLTQLQGGRILVEESPDTQSGDKGWFTITDQSVIFEEQAGRPVRVDASRLAVGQRVRAWADGPVRESYPIQADTAAILILAP